MKVELNDEKFTANDQSNYKFLYMEEHSLAITVTFLRPRSLFIEHESMSEEHGASCEGFDMTKLDKSIMTCLSTRS